MFQGWWLDWTHIKSSSNFAWRMCIDSLLDSCVQLVSKIHHELGDSYCTAPPSWWHLDSWARHWLPAFRSTLHPFSPFTFTAGGHIAILYFSLVSDLLDDQHRNPNINNRDHLVGQLTRAWQSSPLEFRVSESQKDCRNCDKKLRMRLRQWQKYWVAQDKWKWCFSPNLSSTNKSD